MTDEEIIKALERCPQHNKCCFCNSLEECGDIDILTTSVLDLINRQRAEIERLQDIDKRLGEDVDYKLDYIYKLKTQLKTVKSETRKEFADKITEVFKRYKHLHEHADKARNDVIETFDLTEIEMQSVWDVLTLKKNDMAEYEEMGRLQKNIETIAQDRLLTELEKDFKKLMVVEEWQNV